MRPIRGLRRLLKDGPFGLQQTLYSQLKELETQAERQEQELLFGASAFLHEDGTVDPLSAARRNLEQYVPDSRQFNSTVPQLRNTLLQAFEEYLGEPQTAAHYWLPG